VGDSLVQIREAVEDNARNLEAVRTGMERQEAGSAQLVEQVESNVRLVGQTEVGSQALDRATGQLASDIEEAVRLAQELHQLSAGFHLGAEGPVV
jgi:methyl-accepting chemotaxis protein